MNINSLIIIFKNTIETLSNDEKMITKKQFLKEKSEVFKINFNSESTTFNIIEENGYLNYIQTGLEIYFVKYDTFWSWFSIKML